MNTFQKTEAFDQWLRDLRDPLGKARILARRGDVVYLLLCGGDKSSQKKDIKQAKALLKELEV